MRPVFADPKTDIVFKRIFGSEGHEKLVIALLNDLLGLDDRHRILEVQYLSPEQVPPLDGGKLSIVDVKCLDAQGTRYIVEMQILNVEGFEKRLVFNLCKAYTAQLSAGDDYPTLNDVVAVAICDFELWPERAASGGWELPLLSRWRMTEEQSGARRLHQMRYVVMELPKYTAGDAPQSTVDKWAYFFREAKHLREVPAPLRQGAFAEALEAARTSGFTPEEWEAYDRAKIAEQDARGALSLARKEGLAEGRTEGRAQGRAEGRAEGREEGREEGRREGLRRAILDLVDVLGIAVPAAERAAMDSLDADHLEALRTELKRIRAWPASREPQGQKPRG